MLNYQKYEKLASTYWQINALAAKASWETLRQRVTHGPLRATWSLPFEGTLRYMKLGVPQSDTFDVEQLRLPIDSLARLPQPKFASRQKVVVAGVPAEWVQVRQPLNDRVVLFLHGGGYVFGSSSTHHMVIAAVAKATRARILSVDYRLAPEHPYPAALEDAWAAYWWLIKQGHDPRSIVVMGDSAGAGLSVALLLALRDCGAPLPAGAALLSPWLDLTMETESGAPNTATDYVNPTVLRSIARMYAGEHDLREPLISPLFAELQGLPPLLIQAGGAELLIEDGRRFAERARQAGVQVQFEEYEDMVHVFQFWHLIEKRARRAVEHIAQFVAECVQPKPASTAKDRVVPSKAIQAELQTAIGD